MNIKLSELGRHEAWLRLSSIIKAGDKQIQLERKLASELIKNWRESYESALKELFRQIPSEISAQAIEIITQGLSDLLGQSFGSSQAVREEFRKYITRAYESGKSEFAAKSGLSLPDVRAINILTKHNCYWLGEHYGKHIGSKIAELTQNALRDGLGRDELAGELREALGGKVGGYKYWDVVSSAALVRSRSFGCISGMEEAGITEYEILAMGDERMCPICGEMNGQTFSVAATREVIDRTLGITDPDKFKEAMPWHTEPPIGVGKDKLIADGMSIPPFHGRCRCVLVESETVFNTGDDIDARIAEVREQELAYLKEIDELNKLQEDALIRQDYAVVQECVDRRNEIQDKYFAMWPEIKEMRLKAAERGIIYASGLEGTLSETDIKSLIDAVKGAPEDVRKVWNLMESKLNIIDTNSRDSYYSPAERGVYINFWNDKYSQTRPAYSVIFHELGHLIDNRVHAADMGFSLSRSKGYSLFDMLKAEVDSCVASRLQQLKADAVLTGKSSKDIKKRDAYDFLSSEISYLPQDKNMGVSDVFNGVTQGKCEDGWGHKTKYWRDNPSVVCEEFFAQMFSDSIVNPDGLELMKRYIPKSCAVFQKMLEDIIDKE